MYTQLGVVTKGTIIEVNVSELGLVTPGGKVVWGKYAQVSAATGGATGPARGQQHGAGGTAPASWVHCVRGALQVTNNPENDGVVNAVLLV